MDRWPIRLGGVAALAVAAAAPLPARAQPSAQPNAVDLNASYCLAVYNWRLNALDTISRFSSSVPGAAAELHQDWLDLQASKRRLVAYLEPRLAGVDQAALKVSARSAAADLDQTARDRVRARCPHRTAQERLSCSRAAADRTPAGQRIKRCDDLSFLP